MAARIGSLYVDLVMNSQPFVAGMGRASAATAKASADINRHLGLSQRTVNTFASSAGNRSFKPYAIIAASRSYETAADRVNLLRGSLLAVTAVAGGFTAALSTNLLSRYADTAINLSNQLKTVTTSTANLTAIQSSLEEVSQRSRSSLQSTITLYARTARASEQLGLNQQKLLRITETVQKAFSIGGATSAEAQGAAIQLSQGIASDRFSGEEFRSVAENAPVLLRGMAESLGVNIGRLREMAHAGELTAAVVTKAILKASDRIEAEFGQTALSVERAITHVDNKLLEFIGDTDKAFGITSLLSSGILQFGDSLDEILPALTKVGALIGAIFLARNKGGAGGVLGAIGGGLIGNSIGGIEGAIFGSALGGLAGFGASKKGTGFIQNIRDDAKAARARVVELTQAQAELRRQTIAAGRTFVGTKEQVKTGGVQTFAPASAKSSVERETLAIQKLDEKKIQLLDQQRDAYSRLASITSQITPKAAKLADTQLRAEAELAQRLQQRISLSDAVTKATTRETAALGKQLLTGASAEAAVRARIASQKELAANEAAINRQRSVIAERQVRIAGLSSEADRKAAGERIAIGRQIMAQTDEINKVDQQRTDQVRVLAAARTSAESQGAAAVKQTLSEQGRAYKALQNETALYTRILDKAAKAATPLAVGLRAVGSAGASLAAFMGGPWGIAITAASLLLANFAVTAQENAQKIANARRLIDEGTTTAPTGNQAGGLLAKELEAVLANIKTVEDGAVAARAKLREVFNADINTNILDPIGQIVNAFQTIKDVPIQGKVDELAALTQRFLDGQVDVNSFISRIEALKTETDNLDFNKKADEVLYLANTVAGAAPKVDQLKQSVVDLQIAAQDPINLVITQTFDTVDALPIDAPLTNATTTFAAGLGVTQELEAELATLRLVGDARKRAQYTADELAKAEKAIGGQISDAVRAKIAAFVDEKIALENRDAAINEAEKDNPYEKAIANIKEKTAAQQLENQMIGQTTYAIEREKAIRELEAAAVEAKIKLSPELYAAIISEADAYASVTAASEELQKRREAEKEQLDFYKNTFSAFFLDMKNSLLEGASLWDTFANAASNALNKIADRAIGLAADGIFDLIFAAFTGGLTGGLGGGSGGGTFSFGAPPFANGGFTGIGGKYEPAGIVHKGEYVFDAQAVRRIGVPTLENIRNFSGGAANGNSRPSIASPSGVTLVYAPKLDMRNSSMSRAEVRAELEASERRLKRQLPEMIGEARKRGSM